MQGCECGPALLDAALFLLELGVLFARHCFVLQAVTVGGMSTQLTRVGSSIIIIIRVLPLYT